jgi:hypothetical protein
VKHTSTDFDILSPSRQRAGTALEVKSESGKKVKGRTFSLFSPNKKAPPSSVPVVNTMVVIEPSVFHSRIHTISFDLICSFMLHIDWSVVESSTASAVDVSNSFRRVMTRFQELAAQLNLASQAIDTFQRVIDAWQGAAKTNELCAAHTNAMALEQLATIHAHSNAPSTTASAAGSPVKVIRSSMRPSPSHLPARESLAVRKSVGFTTELISPPHSKPQSPYMHPSLFVHSEENANASALVNKDVVHELEMLTLPQTFMYTITPPEERVIPPTAAEIPIEATISPPRQRQNESTYQQTPSKTYISSSASNHLSPHQSPGQSNILTYLVESKESDSPADASNHSNSASIIYNLAMGDDVNQAPDDLDDEPDVSTSLPRMELDDEPDMSVIDHPNIEDANLENEDALNRSIEEFDIDHNESHQSESPVDHDEQDEKEADQEHAHIEDFTVDVRAQQSAPSQPLSQEDEYDDEADEPEGTISESDRDENSSDENETVQPPPVIVAQQSVQTESPREEIQLTHVASPKSGPSASFPNMPLVDSSALSPSPKKKAVSKDPFAALSQFYAHKKTGAPTVGSIHSTLTIDDEAKEELPMKKASGIPTFASSTGRTTPIDIHSVRSLFTTGSNSPLPSSASVSATASSASSNSSQSTAQTDWADQLAAERADRQRSIDANTAARNERLARLAKIGRETKDLTLPRAPIANNALATPLGGKSIPTSTSSPLKEMTSPSKLKSPSKMPSTLASSSFHLGGLASKSNTSGIPQLFCPSLSFRHSPPSTLTSGIAPPLSPNSRLQNQSTSTGTTSAASTLLQGMKSFNFASTPSTARHMKM